MIVWWLIISSLHWHTFLKYWATVIFFTQTRVKDDQTTATIAQNSSQPNCYQSDGKCSEIFQWQPTFLFRRRDTLNSRRKWCFEIQFERRERYPTIICHWKIATSRSKQYIRLRAMSNREKNIAANDNGFLNYIFLWMKKTEHTWSEHGIYNGTGSNRM